MRWEMVICESAFVTPRSRCCCSSGDPFEPVIVIIATTARWMTVYTHAFCDLYRIPL
jgi:hypothetical protein